jgi:SAM-dependent methyltransferase
MLAPDFRIPSQELSGNSPAHRLGVIDQIAEHVASVDRNPLRVLDAGAGRALRLKFPANVQLTGIDISETALAAHTALSERIVGDLQTYPLVPEAFDVIVCWDVLEHINDPGSALLNMSRALATGGLLVIGAPNVWSPKGLVAKLTPHRFHVFVYRRLLHIPHAGEPGHVPFPTYLRLAMSPRQLIKQSAGLGLEVVLARYYEGIEASSLPSLLRRPWAVLTYLANLLSFNAHLSDSDFALVLRKPVA